MITKLLSFMSTLLTIKKYFSYNDRFKYLTSIRFNLVLKKHKLRACGLLLVELLNSKMSTFKVGL